MTRNDRRNAPINNLSIFFSAIFILLLIATLLGVKHLPEATAMGAPPGSCGNEYDYTLKSFTIDNGHGTYDMLANPGLVINGNNSHSNTITFTVHTASQSKSGNTNNGSIWYSSNGFGYGNGECVYNIWPNQDKTVVVKMMPANQIGSPSDTNGEVEPVYWDLGGYGNLGYDIVWFSSVNYPKDTGNSTITVEAIDFNNTKYQDDKIDGLYMNLTQYGAIVSKGYTPVNFTLNDWNNYTIGAADYGKYHFAYWLDDQGYLNSSIPAIRPIKVAESTHFILYAGYYERTSSASQQLSQQSQTSPSNQNPYSANNNDVISSSSPSQSNSTTISTDFVPSQKWTPTGCCQPNPTGTPFTLVLDNPIPSQANAGDTLTIKGHVILGRSTNSSDTTTESDISKSPYYLDYNLLQLGLNLYRADPNQNPMQLTYADRFCNQLNGTTVTTGANGTFTMTWTAEPTTSDGKQAIIYLMAMTGYTGSTINYSIVTTSAFHINISNSPSGSYQLAQTTECFNNNSNLAGGKLIGEIAVGGDPQKIAVNPVTDRVYVSNFGTYNIPVIYGNTDTIVAQINENTGTSGIAVNPETNRVYASVNKAISVIDGSTNQIIANITVGDFPQDIAVNPSTNLIYTANQNLNSISVINGSTNKIVASIPIDRIPQALAIDPTTNRIYAVSSATNTVYVIDGSTNKVVSTIAVGASPWDLAINPDTNRLYVANFDSATISVIDLKSNSVIATIDTGKQRPQGIAVNPVTDRIYVADPFYNDGTVSVFDRSSNSLITSIKINKDPNDGSYYLGINPATNKIYVSDFHGKVSVIDGNAGSGNTSTNSSSNLRPSSSTALPSSDSSPQVIAQQQSSGSGPVSQSKSQPPIGSQSTSTSSALSNSDHNSSGDTLLNDFLTELESLANSGTSSTTATGQHTTYPTVNSTQLHLSPTQPSFIIPAIFHYIPPVMVIAQSGSNNASALSVMVNGSLIQNPEASIPVNDSILLDQGQMVRFTFVGDQPENTTIAVQAMVVKNTTSIASANNTSSVYPVSLTNMCKPYDPLCQNVFKVDNVPAGDYLFLITCKHMSYNAYYIMRAYISPTSFI